jgi:hypothetical protein
MKMPFGIHKGELITNVPGSYLNWIKKAHRSRKIREAATDELTRRDKENDNHEGRRVIKRGDGFYN